MEIAKKLLALRRAKRINQGVVAEETGIIRSSLSNYETGRRTPSIAQLQALASFYGVSLDYFGMVEKEDSFKLIIKAKNFFESEVSNEKKKEVFDDIMKVYIVNQD